MQHEVLVTSPVSESMRWLSVELPSVVTHRDCVSPRVNSAEPWARGRMPGWISMGRTVLVSRPSMRVPSSRMRLRTTFFSM